MENNIQYKSLTYPPLLTSDLTRILEHTIKKDDINKVITFLVELSTYTERDQLNANFLAPSASGKTYLALEISNLFPSEDIIKLSVASPTSFFHEQGIYNKEKNTIEIDLSRKLIIFLDQPHPSLLVKLRSFLSHDAKEIMAKITDSHQKGGFKTKTVIIKGFPAVIFCTSNLTLNEQEATRSLLLSPEITQEKIRAAIYEKIAKETNNALYLEKLEANPERKSLKERICAIKNEHITEIRVNNPELIQTSFFEKNTMLKPRHSRDIGRLISLTKMFALLNLWHREREGSVIFTQDGDIREAFLVWEAIGESQDLGIAPYLFDFYNNVIFPAYQEKNNGQPNKIKEGLTRKDIFHRHLRVYGRHLPDWELRQQILPMLENSGLIIQEGDINDKRKILIYPTNLTNNEEVKEEKQS